MSCVKKPTMSGLFRFIFGGVVGGVVTHFYDKHSLQKDLHAMKLVYQRYARHYPHNFQYASDLGLQSRVVGLLH